MRAPGATELLEVWERGWDNSPAGGAVMLLAAAELEPTTAAVAEQPLGRRDAALLTLHEHLFGASLQAVATCAACDAELEVDFATDDVRTGLPAAAATVQVDGWDVDLRPVTSADLLAAEAQEDVDRARGVLLSRCVMQARRGDGDDAAADDLPLAVIEAVAGALAAADPQADVVITPTCPECGERATVPFDIAAFLLTELDVWARRTLQEVSALAQSHGWTEPEILALSPRRRRFYLDAAGW